MTDAASAAPTYQQVIAAWNAQADEYNQWSELGEDEKIEWAVACAKAKAKTRPLVFGDTTPQPTQEQAGAVPLDEARRLFDAGWKAAARFCDREDVVADGIIGFGACPQFEAAFAAAHGIKGGQHA